MKFKSTKGNIAPVTFREAVLQGLADDGGLYVPERMPRLPDGFWHNYEEMSFTEMASIITGLFWEEPGEEELKRMLVETLNFEVPLVPLGKQIRILELFHGPTLAFKDFGARFMARVFRKLREDQQQEIVILAATSGDTGSAVARGFLDVKGIRVCLLYPSGKVSRLQEQQLTTAGSNVKALEVDGTFDDCQRMVKEAFSDDELKRKLILSSANSINIARLIPQTFYYVYASAQLGGGVRPIFSVPSGNFGNLTAGLWAQKMGMPASGFIAATNANDVVPEYLKSGSFNTKPSVQTMSNAMDVGNPSNFDRILHLFDHSLEEMRKHLWGAAFTDDQTKNAIREVYNTTGYVMDPHTAIGYLGISRYRSCDDKPFGSEEQNSYVILSTAHPAKFSTEMEEVLDSKIPLPERLKACLNKEKRSIRMSADYPALKSYLKWEFT